MKPGVTVIPLASSTCVRAVARLRMSSLRPTARNFPSFTAKASARGCAGSLVSTRALTTMRSASIPLPLACTAAALWVALRHWRSDLVESRRRLRLLLVAAGIGYTLLQLGARLSTPFGLLSPDLALLDIAALVALMGGWSLLMLRLPTPALLQPAARPALPPGPTPSLTPVPNPLAGTDAAAAPTPPSARATG